MNASLIAKAIDWSLQEYRPAARSPGPIPYVELAEEMAAAKSRGTTSLGAETRPCGAERPAVGEERQTGLTRFARSRAAYAGVVATGVLTAVACFFLADVPGYLDSLPTHDRYLQNAQVFRDSFAFLLGTAVASLGSAAVPGYLKHRAAKWDPQAV